MCDEWLNDFMTFYEWGIKNGYKEGLTIDRINVNGDYTPENCRWVENVVQANNKRTNINITFRGKTQSLAEWCRELKLEYINTYRRYKKGIPIEEVFKYGAL